MLVDSLVELGRYRQAGRALQQMVDRKPDLASYARVSYWRELHGDLTGAYRAMLLARSAGGDTAENAAYVDSLLSHIELQRGRLDSAARFARSALSRFPGYPAADAALARVQAARGNLDAAAARLRRVVARLPLTEYVVALGEVELAAGDRAAARRDFALVRAEQRLLAGAGVNSDTELAVFEADHGSPRRGVALARRAWSAAPSVRSADALGWALTRAGRPREGLAWAKRALVLGSRDPAFLAHAGLAARAAGERSAARELAARGPRVGGALTLAADGGAAMRRILLGALLAFAVLPATAQAHPLGNFSVNHITAVSVSRDRVDVRYTLDQAEIPTFQERGLSRARGPRAQARRGRARDHAHRRRRARPAHAGAGRRAVFPQGAGRPEDHPRRARPARLGARIAHAGGPRPHVPSPRRLESDPSGAGQRHRGALVGGER